MSSLCEPISPINGEETKTVIADITTDKVLYAGDHLQSTHTSYK